MTHPTAEKWDKLAHVPCSISSDSRCRSRDSFFTLGFLGGSREFWLRRIWPIKVVFAPLRNAKQTFWKWKDFLLIPFHAHLLSSEVTIGPEEAAWGHQMDRGGAEEVGMKRGWVGWGGSSYSDLVPLSWSQHVRIGTGGGDPVPACHQPWLLIGFLLDPAAQREKLWLVLIQILPPSYAIHENQKCF